MAPKLIRDLWRAFFLKAIKVIGLWGDDATGEAKRAPESVFVWL